MKAHLASCRWEYVASAGSFLPLRDLFVEHADPPDSALQQAIDGAQSCMASARLSGNAAMICARLSRLSAWCAAQYPSLPLHSVRLVANTWAVGTSSVEIIHGLNPVDNGDEILWES